MLMDVSRSVSKETYEMGQALASLVGAIKKALEDGWQPGQDIPVIISAMIAELGKITKGLQGARSEMEAYPAEFHAAVGLALADLVTVVKK
jgi:hypothetical protein